MGLFKNKDYAEIHIKFDERKQDEEMIKVEGTQEGLAASIGALIQSMLEDGFNREILEMSILYALEESKKNKKSKVKVIKVDNEEKAKDIEKLLKPIKERLEKTIDILTKNAILTGKEAEITLKINIGVSKKDREFNDEIEEYLQPMYEYQLSEKIKEEKGSYKSSVGFNYSVEIDDENNIVVKNVNEQQSLFGKVGK